MAKLPQSAEGCALWRGVQGDFEGENRARIGRPVVGGALRVCRSARSRSTSLSATNSGLSSEELAQCWRRHADEVLPPPGSVFNVVGVRRNSDLEATAQLDLVEGGGARDLRLGRVARPELSLREPLADAAHLNRNDARAYAALGDELAQGRRSG